jgi:ribosomal protein L24
MITYYLYVKTHNVTGLNYLGQTKQDPNTYLGSGLIWKHHLAKHSNNVTTVVLQKCYTKPALKEWGIYYSKLWNIVKSNKWANLKQEEGDGGDPGPVGREKIRIANQGKTVSKETRIKLSKVRLGRKQKKCTDEGRANIKAANQGKNLGRVLSVETKAKIKASNKITWARKHLND